MGDKNEDKKTVKETEKVEKKEEKAVEKTEKKSDKETPSSEAPAPTTAKPKYNGILAPLYYGMRKSLSTGEVEVYDADPRKAAQMMVKWLEELPDNALVQLLKG